MNKAATLARFGQLVTLDRKLFKAFKDSEQQSRLPVFNIFKQVKILRRLNGTSLGIWRYYPFLQFIPIVAGVFAVLQDGISFWLAASFYAVTLFMTALARTKFEQGYVALKVGTLALADSAFNINRVPLRLAILLESAAKNDDKEMGLDTGVIESIIKLQKSSQDYEAANYGYIEVARRTLIGSLFLSPVAIFNYYSENKEAVEEYAARYVASIQLGYQGILIVGYTILLIAAVIGIFHYFLYGDRAEVRRRKRYLLMLQILKECLVVENDAECSPDVERPD